MTVLLPPWAGTQAPVQKLTFIHTPSQPLPGFFSSTILHCHLWIMTHNKALEKFTCPSFIFIVLYLYLRTEMSSSVYPVTSFRQTNALSATAAGSKQQVKAAVTTKTLNEIRVYQFSSFKLMNKFVVFTESHYYGATAKTLSIPFTFKLLQELHMQGDFICKSPSQLI